MLSGYNNLTNTDIDIVKAFLSEFRGGVSLDMLQKLFKRDKGFAMQLMEELELRCIVGAYNGKSKREILHHEPFTISITDSEGKHELKSDTDCVWQCESCKSEREVVKQDSDENNRVKPPYCKGCKQKMKFKYWLDGQK